MFRPSAAQPRDRAGCIPLSRYNHIAINIQGNMRERICLIMTCKTSFICFTRKVSVFVHTDFICIYCHKSLININKCCLQISNLYLCFIAFSFLGLYTRLHHCSMNTAVNRYLLSTFWNHPCQILSKYVPAVSCSGAVNHE